MTKKTSQKKSEKENSEEEMEVQKLKSENLLLQQLYNLRDEGFYRNEKLLALRGIGHTLEEIRDLLNEHFQNDSEDDEDEDED